MVGGRGGVQRSNFSKIKFIIFLTIYWVGKNSVSANLEGSTVISVILTGSKFSSSIDKASWERQTSSLAFIGNNLLVRGISGWNFLKCLTKLWKYTTLTFCQNPNLTSTQPQHNG